MNELQQEMQKIGEAIYSAQQAAPQPETTAGSETVDAEVVS
jgi:hypothetical protein